MRAYAPRTGNLIKRCGHLLAVDGLDLDVAGDEVAVARNVATFTNVGGAHEELAACLKRGGLL